MILNFIVQEVFYCDGSVLSFCRVVMTDRLELFNSNSMYNRNKFSIHGGANFGSSGCIDLAEHELKFFEKLKKYGRDMIINVKYPKEKLR